ncbi:MAG: hypothetical protein EZS28_047694, partial [Streblomastix strix]
MVGTAAGGSLTQAHGASNKQLGTKYPIVDGDSSVKKTVFHGSQFQFGATGGVRSQQGAESYGGSEVELERDRALTPPTSPSSIQNAGSVGGFPPMPLAYPLSRM